MTDYDKGMLHGAISALTGAAMAVAVIAFGNSAPEADLSPKAFDTIAAELPECAAEDSTNCHWDARARGNGKGESYVDIRGVALYRRD